MKEMELRYSWDFEHVSRHAVFSTRRLNGKQIELPATVCRFSIGWLMVLAVDDFLGGWFIWKSFVDLKFFPTRRSKPLPIANRPALVFRLQFQCWLDSRLRQLRRLR
jgi:hypothetical protein